MSIDYVSMLTQSLPKAQKTAPHSKRKYPEVLQTMWDREELQEAYNKYLRVCKEQDKTRQRASENKIALLKGLQRGKALEELLSLALETIGDITGDETFTRETSKLLLNPHTPL